MSYSSHSSAPCTGSTCSEPSADWYTDKANDQAGTHHTPPGSEITTLRAENITPYGGWFTYESPSTDEYRHDIDTCWSTNSNGLDDLKTWSESKIASECLQTRDLSRQGIRTEPIVVTELNPNTTYYFRIRDYSSGLGTLRVSNVVSFTTRPDPKVPYTNTHPKVFFTSSQIDSLISRYRANDSRIKYWVNNGENFARTGDEKLFGVSAYLIGRMQNDTNLLARAKDYYLLQRLLPSYQNMATGGNNYRWETPHISAVTDLLWDQLSATQRETILDAVLAASERPENIDPRFTDQDEYTSLTQIQIAHGLTFLGSTDLPASKLQRLEVIFNRALRRWYGAELVKLRRGDAYWGVAGGALEEGTAYSAGTRTYMLETFWMLENAGYPQGEYAPWIWNHARSHLIYPIVPDKTGAITYGDTESNYQSNGTIGWSDWGANSLNICLLDRYGWSQEAGYTRDALTKIRPVTSSTRPEMWSMLCDDPRVVATDYTQLPTAYRSNGVGLVFDRTGWDESATFFMFSAGWRAADHMQHDVGHFSLWSNKQFITHEHPTYDAMTVGDMYQHNVLIHSQARQHEASDARILKAVSTPSSLYILADMTSSYSQDLFDGDDRDGVIPRMVIDKVTRSLYWDKQTNVIVVYDRMVGAPDGTLYQNILGPKSLYPGNDNAPLTPDQIQAIGTGSLTITKLLNEKTGNTHELLMIVNGTGTLSTTGTTRGVTGLVTFSRATGEIQ